MTFEETVQYLYSRLPVYQRTGGAAYKANLNNTLALDSYFNHPHNAFKCIHIAGTNGKGSTSHMLTSILMEAGYKVGLYTSPHLLDMRERIKVNGEMVSKEFVVDFVASNTQIIEKVEPSFFELMVLMSFCYFRDQQVDIAVIETGLGGRLDSTNIITPEVSVITNIGLDHTQFLGETLPKIAGEKAGIIKPSVPVVIGRSQQETQSVFISKAKKCDSEILFADKNEKFNVISNCQIQESLRHIEFKSDKNLVSCDLLGVYQIENIITALTTCDVLNKKNINISNSAIQNGLKTVIKNTGLLGRWQKVNDAPQTYCDTGHNADGLLQIVNQLSQLTYNKLHIVIGLVNDKPADIALNILPREAQYYFTQSSIPRALKKEDLKNQAKALGRLGSLHNSVKTAYKAALSAADKEDCIFVGGSTFVVADFLEFMSTEGL